MARLKGYSDMRIDKLTTQLQQALGEAQSLALANDNQYIDPLHLLVALVFGRKTLPLADKLKKS